MSIQLTCEEVSNCFIDQVPFINEEICDRSPKYKNPWFSLVPKGNFDFSRGYDRSKFPFRSSGVP